MAADLAETRPRYATGAKHIRERRDLAQRQAGRARVSRRDRHRPGQEGRPAQPDPDARRARALAGLVARRQVDRVFLRRVGRIRRWSSALRTARAKAGPTRSKGPASTSSRSGRPTARRSPSSTTARTLYWIDLGTGAVKRIAAEPIYGPIESRLNYAWSPDSKWLAYSLTNRAGFQAIWLYALGSDKSHAVTDGLVEAGEPVFDRSGKYLYFLASTDAGPVKNWFDQSNTDMQATSSVYLVTLAKATANPLLKESDEEGAEEPGRIPRSRRTETRRGFQGQEGQDEDNKDADPRTRRPSKEKPAVVIDLEGIAGRVVALPIEAGHHPGPDGRHRRADLLHPPRGRPCRARDRPGAGSRR